MRRAMHAVLTLAVLACSATDKTTPTDPGDPQPPPPDPGPATVVMADRPVFKPADNTYLTMTLHLKNTGGPGTYAVEVWLYASGPNGTEQLAGRTEPVDVDTGYDETASWQVYDPISSPPVKYVLVFTRNKGSAQYRQTDRFDLQ